MRAGHSWCACGLGLLMLTCTSLRAQAPDTRPAVGRWYLWTDTRGANLLAAQGDSIWFGAQGVFWRYDVPSRTTEAFTLLDGLPADTPRMVDWIVFSERGDCAVGLRSYSMAPSQIYLRPAGGAWVRLPYDERSVRDLELDDEGRVVIVGNSNGPLRVVARWDGGDWTVIPTEGGADRIWHLPGRWVLQDRSGAMSVRVGSLDAPTEVRTVPTRSLRPQDLVHWGDQDYLLSHVPVSAGGPPPAAIQQFRGYSGWAFGTDGPAARPLFDGYVGLDLRTNRPFQMRAIEGVEGGVVCEVHADAPLNGVRLTVPRPADRPLLPQERPAWPVIDGNGHLWVGPHRWDGQAWSLVLPDCQTPFLDRRGWLDRIARLEIREGEARWQLLPTAPPAELGGWNPVERTGWRATTRAGAGELRFVRVGEDGREEVLRRVPYERYVGAPGLRTADGQWLWTFGYSSAMTVCRLADHGLQMLEPGDDPLLDQASDISLTRAADGQIWAMLRYQWEHMPRGGTFLRYDAAAGAFVPGEAAELLDPLAFEFGRWTLAAPRLGNGPTAPLFVREDGQWKRFRGPSADWPNPAPDGTVRAVVGGGPIMPSELMVCEPMIRGDRLLATCGNDGAMEYSATDGRWVRLSESSGLAHFDDQGRRIIHSGWSLLVFDGDPFAPLADPRRDRFEAILRGLADTEYAARDRASRELAALGAGAAGLIEEALARADLDPEARARLEDALADAAPDGVPTLPEPLLRRMHPLIPVLPSPAAEDEQSEGP